MKLQIDTRERKRIPLFASYLKSTHHKFISGIEIVQLKTGDYGTPDMHVGIEYKKEDFLSSTYDSRINKQLRELSDNYEYPYLLIGFDGILDLINFYEGTNPNIIIGKLTSIASRHHVTTLFCGDFLPKFTCSIIKKHYDGQTKTKQYNPIRNTSKKSYKRAPTLKEIKLDNISRLPLVGPQRAKTLLEHYDWSIHNITNASISDLTQVDGIGKRIATQIHEVLK